MTTVSLFNKSLDEAALAAFLATLPESAQIAIENIRAIDLEREGKRRAKHDLVMSLKEDKDAATRALGVFDHTPGNETEERQNVRAGMVLQLANITAKMKKAQATK